MWWCMYAAVVVVLVLVVGGVFEAALTCSLNHRFFLERLVRFRW